jgi:hypothetical protein
VASTPWEGFWSYVRADDTAEAGRISRLANDLVSQYELLTGETINLFLDKASLEWGDNWRHKIDEGLGSVAFFVAVLTPRYFMSNECRREMQSFSRQATELGIKELVLPVLYVDVPSINDDDSKDDLVRLVKEYQWEDWRELRYEDVGSKAYRQAVSRLADRLIAANSRAESMPISERLIQPLNGSEVDSDESPGTLDRLASFEEVIPCINETLGNLTDEIAEVGRIMNNAKNSIDSRSAQGQGFGHRIIVARTTAQKLEGPSQKILALSNRFASQQHTYDGGVRALIEHLNVTSPIDSDDLVGICSFFSSLRELVATARESLSGVEGMLNATIPLEKMSRDLRPPLRVLRKGLTLICEGIEITDQWISLINECPIDCDTIANDSSM